MNSRFFSALASVLLMAPVALATELYFPDDDWSTVEPRAVGWDSDNLDSAVDYAMSRKSSGVVVLHRGRIMIERYQDVLTKSQKYQQMIHGRDSAGHLIEDVASAQKSVVSFLVGVAQEKGLVEIDDPVHQHLGVGWSKADSEQEAAITIRHLITMSSGLNRSLEFVASPGTKWEYNTTAYSRSLLAIAAASGKTPNELTSEWLTQHIGMKDSGWAERNWVKNSEIDANRLGFTTTARDLARFGLLILAEGKWNDQTMLADQEYLRASLSLSQTLNPSYGFLWWLNREESLVPAPGGGNVKTRLIPTAPKDLVAAFGALRRKCYVVPSLDLVVTRLGDAPEPAGEFGFDKEFWRLLMEAAPNDLSQKKTTKD